MEITGTHVHKPCIPHSNDSRASNNVFYNWCVQHQDRAEYEPVYIQM